MIVSCPLHCICMCVPTTFLRCLRQPTSPASFLSPSTEKVCPLVNLTKESLNFEGNVCLLCSTIKELFYVSLCTALLFETVLFCGGGFLTNQKLRFLKEHNNFLLL
uniref:(northern house mosquito) hypothetical protein n=1 Tax=Culex pipiens TaxID=7175 RepID=A0A8D8C9T8_CULPI